MVKVKPTENKSRITVKSNNDTSIFAIKDNLSEYYARLSERWSSSPSMVNGIDYSSKYYAEQSKASAQVAEGIKTETQELVENFDNKVRVAKDDIEQNRINSINAIDSSYSVVIGNMQEKSDEVLTSIEASKAEAVDSINTTKTTILSDIEFVADGEKKEIGDLIDSGKDEIKEAVGDIKILTTLEIGDIGIAPLGIDETKGKRRYLNGQVIIQEQYVQFTNKVKSAIALYPSLACTESEWQTTATMTVGGQVGKFVIDDEAGTIRLPKIIMPIQGLTDLSKLGEIVSAGLPTLTTNSNGAHTHTRGTMNIAGAISGVFHGYVDGGWGALYADGSTYNGPNTSGNNDNPRLMFDASRNWTGATSSAGAHTHTITGTSTTVQQEQIQYPYFIQVATGAETEDNIINEIELNNPFSLLDYKFSEYELNNISWLRSNGQYNSKAIYPAVYDLLLKIYNGTETKAGVSVKLSTETFTDYDFVLNTAEETFRLPIKVKLASGKVVVGNGAYLGTVFSDGRYTTGDHVMNVSATTARGLNLLYASGVKDTNIAVTTDPTKSGIETSDSDLYLYFYVGETVQNANLINAGRIEEKVATLGSKVATLIPDNSKLISRYGMPSNLNPNIALGATGACYDAPANGYYCLSKVANANGEYMALINSSCNLRQTHTAYHNGQYVYGYIPAKQGDRIYIYYTLSGATEFLKFIYAEGDI